MADDQPLLSNISIWDQIDSGRIWSTSKKVLVTVPILLFLIVCEVTDYQRTHLVINLPLLLVFELGPKLPFLQRFWARVLGVSVPGRK